MADRSSTPWEQTNLQQFWNDIHCGDHLVQLYDNEKVFLESLEGFAGSAILAGESLVVIATEDHLRALNERLIAHGFDINQMIFSNQFLPLESGTCLSLFMKEGMPDERLFNDFFNSIMNRVKATGSAVKIFGEMVSDLWKEGNKEATIKMEEMWTKLCKDHKLMLFCAYPKTHFTEEDTEHLQKICSHHNRIIGGWSKPSTEIYHRYSLS